MSRLGLVDVTKRGLGRERVVTRAWHHRRTRSKESTMHMRRLGSSSPWVSEIGLGCVGMSEYYGPADGAESVATIHAALDRGVTLLDTGGFDGMADNGLLVRRALTGQARDGVQISVKFGAQRDPLRARTSRSRRAPRASRRRWSRCRADSGPTTWISAALRAGIRSRRRVLNERPRPMSNSRRPAQPPSSWARTRSGRFLVFGVAISCVAILGLIAAIARELRGQQPDDRDRRADRVARHLYGRPPDAPHQPKRPRVQQCRLWLSSERSERRELRHHVARLQRAGRAGHVSSGLAGV